MNFIQRALAHMTRPRKLGTESDSSTKLPGIRGLLLPDRKRFNYTDFKDLENQIIRGFTDGTMKVRKYRKLTSVSTDYYIEGVDWDFTLRTDHSFACGTFTFFYVNGIDVTNDYGSRFDVTRVAGVLEGGTDVPTNVSDPDIDWYASLGGRIVKKDERS